MDRKWWTLIAVCTATFMLLVDVTIVNVALPSIEQDLHSSFSDLQWVIDAYALTLAAMLLTGGSLADRIGRRRVFVVGLGIFTGASILCGLASTPLMLTLSRALQGTGGALMFATSLALLAAAFQGRERGTALGLWGATTGAAVAIGPLAGGVLTEAIGWQAIFFVNVPIGLAAVAMTLARVAESKDPTGSHIDVPGTLTFSISLFLLVFGLIRGNAEGWGSTLIVGCLGGAVVLMAAFVLSERRHRDPMLDLSLFRRAPFVGASLAAFVLSAAMFAMYLYLTLYMQNILGYSALQSGVRFIPNTMLAFLAAPISGKFAERVGVRWFIAGGLALVGIGLLLMNGLKPGDDWTALLAGFLVAGGGIGIVNPALATAAIGVVEPRQAGMASGINSTFRQVGISTGIAAWGAIFQHVVRTEFVRGAAAAGAKLPPAGRSSGVADFIAFGGARRSGNPQFAKLGEQAFVAGLNHLLLLAAIVAFAGAALSALLLRPAERSRSRSAVGARAASVEAA
jgi:EmrB/QacA subfamily drug resistance transporter